MFAELRALGILKKEEKEEVYLLHCLQALTERLEEDLSRGAFKGRETAAREAINAITDFAGILRIRLAKAGVPELQIRTTEGRIQLAYQKEKRYTDFKRYEHNLFALQSVFNELVTIENQTFEKMFDHLAIKDTSNIYKFLIRLKHHVQTLARQEARTVEQLIEEDIRDYFLHKPEKVNIIANLLRAHGGDFEFGLVPGPSGGIPSGYPRTIYLADKRSRFRLETRIKNVFQEQMYLITLGKTLDSSGVVKFNSTAERRRTHSAVSRK